MSYANEQEAQNIRKKYCIDFACIYLSLCHPAEQAEVQGQIFFSIVIKL